ncbi:MAG: hypothetical protein J0L55_09590 [Caulobacterales bacterium]|nr:hypothetical protein [Caulobacterales bacterium]MCA0372649.1 hypothetical protein [Pseudomonadota bacterium]
MPLRNWFIAFIFASFFAINFANAQNIVPIKDNELPSFKLNASISGTVKTNNEYSEYQWPGIYFVSKFRGTEIGFKFDDKRNKFKISIDNKEIGQIVTTGANSFKVIGLSNTNHQIRIDKISESLGHSGRFYGFFSGYNFASKPLSKKRKIEIIGDSYSVGYGNLSLSHKCSREQLFDLTDNSKSYGVLMANAFDADYQINAYSGIGIVRNYNNAMFGKPIGYFYGKSIFDAKKNIEENDFHPNIINLLLGTNDFSTKIKPDEKWKNIDELKVDYVKTYAEFINELRRNNHNALILISINIDANKNHMAAYKDLEKLFSNRDKKIKFVILPATKKSGCDWHPDLYDHAAMAQILISTVKDLGFKF